MAKNYYNILNVQKNADQQDIKNAYVQKVIDNQFSGNTNKTKDDEIAEAYQVLSNQKLRQEYDNQGAENFNKNNTHKFKSSAELVKEL